MGLTKQSDDLEASRMSEDFVLEVTDAKKSFGRTAALRGVSFAIPFGQQVALLGPNGAGKTSLIRSICGRYRLDQGSIKVCGRSHVDPKASAMIGLIPQEIAVYGDLTARENLVAFGSLNGLRRSELYDRVAWGLNWIGLQDRADQLVKHFSGGMKRRVNIACGVLHAPRLILLDEPTVGVDPQSRTRIHEMLDELHEGGASLLLTTHQLEEAEGRCDRMIVVDQGRVIADGSMEDLAAQLEQASHLVQLEIRGLRRVPTPSLRPLSRPGLYETCLRSVGEELETLLRVVRASGGTVVRVDVRAPQLKDLYLAMTGSGLRE